MALLDDVGGATFAFSLSRYLKTAFEGSAVCRLRENAGSTELDFKLDGSNVLVSNDANLDTVSEWLTANSATTAFVVSVYDHSGNNRTFTQATTTSQPILVENSNLNGLAALNYAGNAEARLESGSITITSSNGIEIYSLVYTGSSIGAADQIIFSDGAASLAYAAGNSTGWIWQADFGEVLTASTVPATTTKYQMTHRYPVANTFVINENGVQVLDSVNPGGPIDWRTGTHVIGNTSAAAQDRPWTGLISEIVFYNGVYTDGNVTTIQNSLLTQGGIDTTPIWTIALV